MKAFYIVTYMLFISGQARGEKVLEILNADPRRSAPDAPAFDGSMGDNLTIDEWHLNLGFGGPFAFMTQLDLPFHQWVSFRIEGIYSETGGQSERKQQAQLRLPIVVRYDNDTMFWPFASFGIGGMRFSHRTYDEIYDEGHVFEGHRQLGLQLHLSERFWLQLHTETVRYLGTPPAKGVETDIFGQKTIVAGAYDKTQFGYGFFLSF